MNHYPHYSYTEATGMGKPLVQKMPAHLRYASVLQMLLGGALCVSVAALGYTTTLLGHFTETSVDLAEKVSKLEQVPPLTNFCPFPFNPTHPGCQAQAVTKVEIPPVAVATPKATTVSPASTALGWVYAGKNNLQNVIQTDGNLLTGKVYTMLKNLNVRRLPVSSKVNENRHVLHTVLVGEKVRVLAQANNGEHLWLKIAHP